MHGGVPGIGFSTLVYGVVWIATNAGRAALRLGGRR
jgi:hypothetical protein